jgi:hypothetical protein
MEGPVSPEQPAPRPKRERWSRLSIASAIGAAIGWALVLCPIALRDDVARIVVFVAGATVLSGSVVLGVISLIRLGVGSRKPPPPGPDGEVVRGRGLALGSILAVVVSATIAVVIAAFVALLVGLGMLLLFETCGGGR